MGTQFEICVPLFIKNWRISTSDPVAVQWVDSVLQETDKPTLGENEISKRQFNLMQVISAIVDHPIAAVPLYIPDME